MNIIIKATKLDLTPAIEDYIYRKIGSLSRFLKKIEEKGELKTEIEIARTTRHHQKGNVFYAEINLHLPKKILRAERLDQDIRTAIDKVKDKLQQEIIKYKERHV